MNNKQSKRLMHVATKHATLHGDDAIETKTLSSIFKKWIKGEQVEEKATWTTYWWKQDSTKRIYKDLKREYLTILRPLKSAYLANLENFQVTN